MTPAEQFVARGWLVVDLHEPAVVHEIGEQLLAWLRADGLPTLQRLEDYHLHATDAAEHARVHVALADRYWDARLGHRLVATELDWLRGFVGLDLHVQRHPYLRIARPGCTSDVTGLHRDLLYGASPYEVSLLVPFTDLDTGSALRVVSGSHTEPRASYPATRTESADVQLGSPKHRLGFPYAPQVLDPEVARGAEPVPLHVGQALLMSLGLVHGQTVNESTSTRFSTDVRVVNSLAPVELSRGVRDDYYEPLVTSPVTEQARRQLATED